MKLDVDATLTPEAAGPGRAICAVLPELRSGKDINPPGVVIISQGEGRTVRHLLSSQEALNLGASIITCACVAMGGPPPVAQVEVSKDPHAAPGRILDGNGRGL